MKLDNMIADGIENTLDERLLQYTADLKKHHFSAFYKIRRHQTIRSRVAGTESATEALCQTNEICSACGNSCCIPADRIQCLVFCREIHFQCSQRPFGYIFKQNF